MISLLPTRPTRHIDVLSCLLTILLATSTAAAAAPIDEFRISDIERKIHDLETTTREQARLITQLQSQAPGTKVSTAANTISTHDEQRWLIAGNWTRLKPGMSELQVIELLGVPTQVRSSEDGQTRSLLYAMEIGRSGFLSGKVELQSSKLTLIELPHLK